MNTPIGKIITKQIAPTINADASHLTGEKVSKHDQTDIDKIRSLNSASVQTAEVSFSSIKAKALFYKQLPENIKAIAGGYHPGGIRDSKLPNAA
jgi:hypothetical protein